VKPEATSQHPSELMLEEMAERRWTRDDLATAMMRADDDNWGIHRLAIDLYFELGPTDRRMRLGQSAAHYARAFGTSTDVWLALESAWLGVDGGAQGDARK
jgi:hypothetical protein